MCFCNLEYRKNLCCSVNLQIPINSAGYLRCVSGYEEGVGAPRVVVVMHRCCYVECHELQRWDVPSQAAVAVVRNGAAFGGGVTYPPRRDPAVGIWNAKTQKTDDSFVCVSVSNLSFSAHHMIPSCISPEMPIQPVTIIPVTNVPPVSLPVTCSLCIC